MKSSSNSIFILDYSQKDYGFLLLFSLFVVMLVLFGINDIPENYLEFKIESILTDRVVGFYSHSYPFQSRVMSNILMYAIPFLSVILALRRKVKKLSEEDIQEMLKKGFVIHKDKFDLFILKSILLLILIGIFSIYIYTVYFYYEDLTVSSNRNTFYSDNILVVFLQSYLYLFVYTFISSALLSIIFHPIVFIKSNMIYPSSRKEKMLFDLRIKK